MSRFARDPYREYEAAKLIERVVAMGPIRYRCAEHAEPPVTKPIVVPSEPAWSPYP